MDEWAELLDKIIITGFESKSNAAIRDGFKVDIWIDDRPEDILE